MTRIGSTKAVDGDYAHRRLANARAYWQAAHDAFELAGEGGKANPVMSQIVNAAIAYADALTASRKSLVNQKDHGGVVKLLRESFGRELPIAQERHLRRILEEKDEVQYGVSVGRYADAKAMLADLDEFKNWAERQMIGS